MEFYCDITIKSSKNEVIEFKTAEENNKLCAITGVKFGFNSDNSSRERDRNGRVEIAVYGKFDGRSDTLTAIRQLSEWSKSNSDIYREVTIVAWTEDEDSEAGNVSRTYHFDKMFCIDYFEKTGVLIDGSENSGLTFELFMAQAPTYKISETKAELI